MSNCCLRGFRWNGKPAGTESKIGNHNTYIAGDDKHAAVLMVTDLYGWRFKNIRLLADHYAEEAGVAVFVPDFFGGEELPSDILSQLDRRDWDKIDLPGFLERNSKEIREPEMVAVCNELRRTYKKLGAVGFCYGGWAVFRLGGAGLVDCISTAHPSLLEKGEIDKIRVPVQIMAPEKDDMFTEELKAYSLDVIPKLGVPFDYQYFPGLEHAFAVRGNPEDAEEQKGMERAKNCVVAWMRQWLHEKKPVD